MRIDLKKAPDLAAAFERLAKLAAAAHASHEAAGGYSFEHAIYRTFLNQGSELAGAKASLDHHMAVEEARRAACAAINMAQHGNAISAALKTFQEAVAT